MKSVMILFRGSQPEPYCIHIARRKDGQLKMSCDCPAGIHGTHCKHRISLLTSDYKNVVYSETTHKDLELINSWIPGTEVESALAYMSECDRAAQAATKELKNAKRKLARVMEGK